MLVEEAKKCSFVLVGNIPSEMKSADLRAFFSHLVEKQGFVCFHYRHRPEHAQGKEVAEESVQGHQRDISSTSSVVTIDTQEEERDADENKSTDAAAVSVSSRCCVVALATQHERDFLRRYRGRHWTKLNGELLRRKVKLSRVIVAFDQAEKLSDNASNHSQTTFTPRPAHNSIPWSDIYTIPELNPPSVMPYGNVGTATSVFIDLIRECKLPGRVIKKLCLEFPKSRSKRRYGAVRLDYGCDEVVGGESEEQEEGEERETEMTGDGGVREEEEKSGDEDLIPSDDDHDAEEWERYEALHDDVDKQGRTKERLFEEEMEVVWEKGGSGLVFYTDASHWHNLEGDFDEQCSKEDDWDVDTSLYYDQQSGDKGARDLMDIRHEQSVRNATEQTSVFAGFERYTKGIGSKVLKRSGWKQGSGVGRASDGRAEPVETEGQHPSNKTGFGYRGEKLIRHGPFLKRPCRSTRDVIISTVYDRQDEQETTIMRSAPSRTIKYRQQGIQFVAGKTLTPTTSAATCKPIIIHK